MIDRLTTLLLSRAADEFRARLSAARAIFSCCLMLATAASAANLACEFRTTRPEWGAYAVCPVDADGDSADELYMFDYARELLEGRLGEYFWFRGSPHPHGADCDAWTANLAGDSASDVVLTAGANESVWVRVIAAGSGMTRQFLVNGGHSHGASACDYAGGPAAFADLNGDSTKGRT